MSGLAPDDARGSGATDAGVAPRRSCAGLVQPRSNAKATLPGLDDEQRR